MSSRLPPGYAIRALEAGDGPALAAAYDRNRDHLAPWDPARPASFYTATGQAALVRTQLATVATGGLEAHVLTWQDQVVGRININNIVRGVLRSGALGYWTDGDHLRRGLAGAAVAHAVARAREIGLHRLEAGTLVHNTASQQVLLRAGFTEYGLAPRFLFIAGAWQDHRLFQLILHDDPPTS